MKLGRRKYRKGVSLVNWLIALVPILGIGAFAVDLNQVMASKVILESAADAGALEATRLLYCPDSPETLNKYAGDCGIASIAALTAGANAASTNLSTNQIDLANVVVQAELGHWQFFHDDVVNGFVRGGVFTPHDLATATAQPLVDANGHFRTFQNLNADPEEINAVRLIVRRTDTAVEKFFLNAIYNQNFSIEASAVAYLGFAGTVVHDTVDAPLAMCFAKIPDCGYGSFITPGTAGGSGIWSNLASDVTQCLSANANEVVTLIKTRCRQSGMNPADLTLGARLGIISGAVATASQWLRDCWMDNGVLPIDSPGTIPTTAWRITIPVMNCAAAGTCKSLIGVMETDIVWYAAHSNACDLGNLPVTMTRTDKDGIIHTWSRPARNPPSQSNAAYAIDVWNSFADYFHLKEPPAAGGTWSGATRAPCSADYIYFVPYCGEGTPTGGTGGGNFGIRATEAVLVY